MGWISRLIIDLHRHLAGQRFEAKIASNEIDFAESGIPKAALSDALKRLLAARKMLLELTGVFRKFGSTDVGEADDYGYLQQLLDQALGQPFVRRYFGCACSLIFLFVRAQLDQQMSSTRCHQKKLTIRRALVLVLALVAPTVSERERGARLQLEQSPKASELAWTMKTNVMPIHYFTRYDAD
jgi:hypothetical protein